jgi:poly(3-hydroxybutyrate) depolymerase
MLSCFQNNYLYSFVEAQRQLIEPYRQFALISKEFQDGYFSQTKFGRSIAASYDLFERLTRHYQKPQFCITQTLVDGKKVEIHEKVISSKTFCKLLHFKKNGSYEQPKMLVVAPMSGHYATLLRGTVEGLLPYFDVYITDWVNACEVPVEDGDFHFDDFVSYVTEYMQKLGPNLNVMAVCQPSVPVSVAVALMSKENDPMVPDSLTLMGGPIDTRKNPTEVNDYAAERTICWLERNVITKVPLNYAGAGRLVYPGFTQLSGFMAMNMQTHIKAHWDLFKHLVNGDGESVATHKKFYNEYLSVMDLPAEFYLDTVNIVFKQHSLPRGKLVSNGKKVSLADIKKTALLCIEGEHDDISGLGQTKAAITLCTGLPDSRKKYHMQKDVGHFGIFNGRRYREFIVPIVKEFVDKHARIEKEKPAAKPAVKKAVVKKAAAKPAVKKKAVVKKAAAKPFVKKEAVVKDPAKAVVAKKPKVVKEKVPVVKKRVAPKPVNPKK